MSILCNSKKQIPSERSHATSAHNLTNNKVNKRRFSSYYEDKERVQGSMEDVYQLKLYVKLLQKEKMKALAEAAKLEAQISDVEVKIAQNELKFLQLDMYGRASKKLRIGEDCKSKPREVLKHKSSEKENSERKHKMSHQDSKSKSISTERKHTDIKSSKSVQSKAANASQKKSCHHKSKNKTSHSELPVTEEKMPQKAELPQKTVINQVVQRVDAKPPAEEAANVSQKKTCHHKSKNKTSHSELPVTEEKMPQSTELPQKTVVNQVQRIDAKPPAEDMTDSENLENNKINNMLFKELMESKHYKGKDDACSINSACTLILKTGKCPFNDDLVQIK